MSVSRPTVNVYSAFEKKISGTTPLPEVFSTPLRPDLVEFVHTQVRKNARQAYAVSRKAGHRTTAESWGTGRAVARIPRVSGGGSSRSGQGAYGNMCRGGHMSSATKIFRRWHRCVNKKEKRLALRSALAATAVPSLVLSRGHRIEKIPEIPLVIEGLETVDKTKAAVELLKTIEVYEDVEKVISTKHIRPSKGKWRNRRYLSKKGPMIIHNGEIVVKAFDNITGVEIMNVNYLNLLKLAPGGHLGRLVVWTKGAFEKCDEVCRTEEASTPSFVTTRDINSVINSVEVKKTLRIKKKQVRRVARVSVKNKMKTMLPFAGILKKTKDAVERKRKVSQKKEKV